MRVVPQAIRSPAVRCQRRRTIGLPRSPGTEWSGANPDRAETARGADPAGCRAAAPLPGPLELLPVLPGAGRRGLRDCVLVPEHVRRQQLQAALRR